MKINIHRLDKSIFRFWLPDKVENFTQTIVEQNAYERPGKSDFADGDSSRWAEDMEIRKLDTEGGHTVRVYVTDEEGREVLSLNLQEPGRYTIRTFRGPVC